MTELTEWHQLVWPAGSRRSVPPSRPAARLARQLGEVARFTAAAAADRADLHTLSGAVCRAAASGLEASFTRLILLRRDRLLFLRLAGDGPAMGTWRGPGVDGHDGGHVWTRTISAPVFDDRPSPNVLLEAGSPMAADFNTADRHFLQILARTLTQSRCLD